MTRTSVLLDQFGKEIPPTAPEPRRRMRSSYDPVRDTPEFRNYWQHADADSADKANSKAVRHKLMRYSRYERGSSAYYAGICETHCNMLVGAGPSLRCTSANRRFNQFIETSFFRWWQASQFRRKLWCMAHARAQDGEGFGVLVNNPLLDSNVQLDVLLIEAEQVTTPFLPFGRQNYIDGIKFDEFHNIQWYDVLPQHPGGDGSAQFQDPVRVPKEAMLHWFKMQRPGMHRGVPALTSSLNCGAAFRRWKEATVAKAETQMDYTVFLKTDMLPGDLQTEELDEFTTAPIDKRLLTILPRNTDPVQLESDAPNAQYGDFHRSHVSELGRPLSMPYNLTACDSSTYSFASGKMDFLAYKAALDVERTDCNDLILDPLFRAWYREWALVTGNRNAVPAYQWDWPAHPIIDAVAEANAIDINLKNGTTSLRDVCTDKAQDYEDQLRVKAEDMFGDTINGRQFTDEERRLNIEKVRIIDTLKNTPQHAIQYVAQILGVELPAPEPSATSDEED